MSGYGTAHDLPVNDERDAARSGECGAPGMALAYVLVAIYVVFGLETVGKLLKDHMTRLQLIGGFSLVTLGWWGLWSEPVAVVEKGRASRYPGGTASFPMTLFNPVPFATFAAGSAAVWIAFGLLLAIAGIM